GYHVHLGLYLQSGLVPTTNGVVRSDGLLMKSRHSHEQSIASDERVCSRRQKKYESPQSTLVVADRANAAGRSYRRAHGRRFKHRGWIISWSATVAIVGYGHH